MGLDQYAFARMNGTQPNEFAYWRKHNRLQGWMENLWTERGSEGGTDTVLGDNSFNCVDLELKTEDLDKLELAINNRELPETAGFFFGSDSYEEYEQHYKQKDLDFIEAARKHLAGGYTVVYHCWW